MEKKFYLLVCPNHSPSLREDRTETQDRNLGVETEAETTEEHCLVASTSWPAQFAFLYSRDTYPPRVSIMQKNLGPPILIINARKCPTALSKVNLMEPFSQSGSFFSEDSNVRRVAAQQAILVFHIQVNKLYFPLLYESNDSGFLLYPGYLRLYSLAS